MRQFSEKILFFGKVCQNPTHSESRVIYTQIFFPNYERKKYEPDRSKNMNLIDLKI